MTTLAKSISNAALRTFVRVQTSTLTRADRLAEGGRIERRATGFGVACGSLMTFGFSTSAAQAAGAASGGCTSGAATGIQSFISSAANFAIGIGAGGATLMIAVGALLIIFGGTPDRVSKGMKIIKNSVIGLGILAAGLFIKFIIIKFVLGATTSPANSCLNTGGSGI